MNILTAVIEWRTRRKAAVEERNRLLQERIARLFNEPAAPVKSSRLETGNEESYETAQTVNG